MGAVTKIEWCDHTFNPWWGCTQVSPLCDRCYAMMLDIRWYGRNHWGPGAPRRYFDDAYWRQPVHLPGQNDSEVYLFPRWDLWSAKASISRKNLLTDRVANIAMSLLVSSASADPGFRRSHACSSPPNAKCPPAAVDVCGTA
jgi:hypothetical protein